MVTNEVGTESRNPADAEYYSSAVAGPDQVQPVDYGTGYGAGYGAGYGVAYGSSGYGSYGAKYPTAN